MTYLLDTNACIRYLNGRSQKLRKRINSVARNQLVLCSVVEAELYFGAAKSAEPTKTFEKHSKFVSRFRSLTFDSKAAEAYGPIRAALEQAGTPIGSNDLMIAAIAIANHLTLITRNTAEFQRVPGLQLEDWEA